MDKKGLSDAVSPVGKLDFSKIYDSCNNFAKDEMPKFEIPRYEMPEITAIDSENTIVGDIKRKIEEQNNLVSQQMSILLEQNKLLADNYDKLKNMYDQQVKINSESKEELEKSRWYNRWMMVIAIVAMMAAIAGPIVTLVVSK